MSLVYPASNIRWGKDDMGHYSVSVADYSGPTAAAGGYVAGGEAVAAGQVKLGTIEMSFGGLAPKDTDGSDAVLYHYNLATGKIQAFWGNGAAASQLVEVTAGTDLSGYTGRLVFFGRG